MNNTAELKQFARDARRTLIEHVNAKLEWVLDSDSAELRQKAKSVNVLKQLLKTVSKEILVDRVAYTWFNRLCALRYMDVKGYNQIKVISPAPGFTQPEILHEAKQGHIDDSLGTQADRLRVSRLLSGAESSPNPQAEAYRILLIAVCNHYHQVMPFLFQRIEDYTELLMPGDLLSDHSLAGDVRRVLTPDTCKDVEVIGWLYQFYISEKKDQVFDDLKKNKKITPQNIPAATQLFTPNWIVRYLVQNSLGRLWMLNHPTSGLKAHMEYYIEPETPETGFIAVSSPEELRVCDPACGSGHMLVYAFDLLYEIYCEAGYNEPEIPGLILTRNLYGIEIDERAGELAALALVMKAREKYRRFFKNPVQPNICVLENIVFDIPQLNKYIDEFGKNLFTLDLQATLLQFAEADNFGSLIRPRLKNVPDVLRFIEEKRMGEKMFLQNVHKQVIKALEMAQYLGQKYHVVVANPPYMGGKGMNEKLKKFASDNHPDSKSDLFAMFIERGLEMVVSNGMTSMITMQSWMFLSSFEKMRLNILNQNAILTMAHLGARAFDSISGEVVSTTAFVLTNIGYPNYKGTYLRLTDGSNEADKRNKFLTSIHNKSNPSTDSIFCTSTADFKKIPGSPISYWISNTIRDKFNQFHKLHEIAKVKQGLATADNDFFLRLWFEISHKNFCIGAINSRNALASNCKWFPHSKGGEFRRWYGNREYLVNWKKDGDDLKNFKRAVIRNENLYFQETVTWSLISTGATSFRYTPRGNIIGHKGPGIFADSHSKLLNIIGQLNSSTAIVFLKSIVPSFAFEIGQVSLIPSIQIGQKSENISSKCITLSKSDWDSYETSWDFTDLPLLRKEFRRDTLEETYAALRSHWQEMTQEMQRLEEENNRIFIEAYGLQDEMTPDVPPEEITLTCNPRYRYAKGKSHEELESLLLADTMKEFISYAVGCMFGRYSLDVPGLVLANRGDTAADYHARVPSPVFAPDDDNVIPVLEDEWFIDDMAARFQLFLRETFGAERYADNLAFMARALGKDIRKYFIADFYNDHVKRYKKRPIYWMFTSPKGSFNALIYMHRYRPDTVSVVLNDYLREFRSRLDAKKDQLNSTALSEDTPKPQQNRAKKEAEKIKKIIGELETWERDTLFPLATTNTEIDLDDGVKVNYNKFPGALKKIPGLSK